MMHYRKRNHPTDSGGCAHLMHKKLPSCQQSYWACLSSLMMKLISMLTLTAVRPNRVTSAKEIQTALPDMKLVASCCFSPGGHI